MCIIVMVRRDANALLTIILLPIRTTVFVAHAWTPDGVMDSGTKKVMDLHEPGGGWLVHDEG